MSAKEKSGARFGKKQSRTASRALVSFARRSQYRSEASRDRAGILASGSMAPRNMLGKPSTILFQ